MKLNIVRAWKDDIYRQSLSNEQMDMLPASPVGEMELTDLSLEFIYGTGGGGGYPMPAAPAAPAMATHREAAYHPAHGVVVGTATSAASESQECFHSLALRCNETIFSLTSSHGFSFLSPVNAFCINEGN